MPETLRCLPVVMPFLFDEDEPSSGDPGGDTRRARACKRVEHDSATRRIRFDKREQRADGFLRGMTQVSGVAPRQHVARRVLGNRGTTLRQQIGNLVMRLGVASPACVAFDPDQMADGPQAAPLPDAHEPIDFRPAIEADAEAVRFEHTRDLRKRRFQPFRAIEGCVIVDRLPIPGTVAYEIRRIGHRQVHARAWKFREHRETVAVRCPVKPGKQQFHRPFVGIRHWISFRSEL